jgi:hypothetical protein
MASEGILTVGDQIVGYSERNGYLYWDISPDLISERKVVIETPFYRLNSWRYGSYSAIDHIYTTRWAQVIRAYAPITERRIVFNFKLIQWSERTAYVYQDTRERIGFVEGLFTQTPLLLKYPKYYNWHYVPQVLTPEFYIWSFYELSTDDITLKIITDKGKQILLNSGKDKDKFKIEKVGDKKYKITVYVDEIFEEGEKVSVYLSAYDVKGNELKSGFW